MTDDRFEEFLRDAAHDYQEPPATPREEIWARVEAARKTGAPRVRNGAPPAEVIDLGARRRSRPWLTGGLALAAVLLLGVAIGRWSLPELSQPAEPAPSLTAADREATARGEALLRFATVEHLARIDELLTDYQTGPVTDEFTGTARSLLSRTRLLLDSKRLVDPTLRKLLQDLEQLLVQVAQLSSDGQGEERSLIDDDMAEQAIRPRLRNAIPAGPAA
jgi:hypothetical protein